MEGERKLFHIAWAILPLLYYFGYPRIGMLILIFLELLIWTGLEVARKRGFSVISPSQMRAHEKSGMPMGTFFQIASLFLAVLLFEKDIAIMAMLFNCVGDAITSYAGALLYFYIDKDKATIRDYDYKASAISLASLRDDLLYALRHRKSFVLMAIMFVACAAIGFIVYPRASLILISAGALGAVVADAFAWRLLGFTLDDDLTITLASGGAMALVAGL